MKVCNVEWEFEKRELWEEQAQSRMHHLQEIYEDAFNFVYNDKVDNYGAAFRMFKDYLSDQMDSEDVKVVCEWLFEDERFKEDKV